MKGWRKCLTGLLAVSLASGISACSTQEATQEVPENGKYTITSLDFVYGDIPPKDGEGVRMIEEKFQVDYQREYGVYTDYLEKLTARMASGDIPDVIGFESQIDRANFFRWAKQGAFLPLNEYIDDYPTLKAVPQEVWNAVTVDGKIYAIPKYFPKYYLNTPVIRQDWLDNLGLKMPTNYEELKEVAIAFTKNDPDGNGKDDTYGMVLGKDLWPHYHFGAYWDMNAWYHQNERGQYVPGVITEHWKEFIRMMRELYQEGAIPKDFAVYSPTEAVKEFYAGKAGIFVRGPVEMPEANMEALQKIHPKADPTPIPPFEAPDGSRGYTAGSGYYMMNALSAKLKDEPGKVRRILEIIDFGRRFYSWEERNPDNEDFDWMYGHEGKGYHMVDGRPVITERTKGMAPWHYLLDNKMWAPSDEANRYSLTYKNSAFKELAEELEKMHAETRHWLNPIHQVYSETEARIGLKITRDLLNEQAKMITGDLPLSAWDRAVRRYLESGGQQMIEEVNREIKEKNVRPRWE